MFVPIPLLVAMVATIFILAALLWRGKRDGRDLMTSPRARAMHPRHVERPVATMATPNDLPAGLREQASALMAANRKLEAIKLIREETGFGLKESKDIAEQL